MQERDCQLFCAPGKKRGAAPTLSDAQLSHTRSLQPLRLFSAQLHLVLIHVEICAVIVSKAYTYRQLTTEEVDSSISCDI